MKRRSVYRQKEVYFIYQFFMYGNVLDIYILRLKQDR